jgi:starch synthase
MVSIDGKGAPMNVLFVSAEVAPFAKTGGLGDVCGALPRYLARLGNDVRVVLPLYRRVREYAQKNGVTFSRVLDDLSVQLGHKKVTFSIIEAKLPGTGDATTPAVSCYFVANPGLYDRQGIYTQDADEHLRFALLQWAALKLCQFQRFAPDIVHANDWQTALLPLMVKTAFAWDKLFAKTKTVLTIHNIGHQGGFPADVLGDTGLTEVKEHFHQEFLTQGRINFLLTGILYADAITTVSPTYAREITTAEHGVGMDPFLRSRGPAVLGILNGIDDVVWNPETDKHLAAHYSEGPLRLKAACKAALQREMGLPERPDVPLLGMVSRLVTQKGIDIFAAALDRILAEDAQVVVLGSGEGRSTRASSRAWHGSTRTSGRLPPAFSEPLAHLIEAGARTSSSCPRATSRAGSTRCTRCATAPSRSSTRPAASRTPCVWYAARGATWATASCSSTSTGPRSSGR